jgi:transcriptional regulator with XRE-family HTH domain
VDTRFGAYFEHLLMQKGLSQKELARRMRSSQGWVWSVLNGKRAIPLRRLDAVAKALALDQPEREEFRRQVLLSRCAEEIQDYVAALEYELGRRSPQRVADRNSGADQQQR